MTLTHDQLDTYDANSQNEFVLQAADKVSGVVERGTDLPVEWSLHIPHTLGMVDPNEIKDVKNKYINGGTRYVMAKVVDAVPQIQEWADAVKEFISSMVNLLRDSVGDALGWKSDRQALAEKFAKDSSKIEDTVKTLAEKEGVNPTHLMHAMVGGVHQATSSFDAIQEELKKEGQKAVNSVLGKEGDAQDQSGNAALAAAGETYRNVYRAALNDLREKCGDYDSNPTTQDALRTKAHYIAAQISGMHYDGAKQALVATPDAEGKYGGMLGYIGNSITVIDKGQAPTIGFTLAPETTVEASAAQEKDGAHVDDGTLVSPPSTPAKPAPEKAAAR